MKLGVAEYVALAMNVPLWFVALHVVSLASVTTALLQPLFANAWICGDVHVPETLQLHVCPHVKPAFLAIACFWANGEPDGHG